MDWLQVPDGPFFYVPSAVLILWSALFVFMYFRLKKTSHTLLVWSIAAAILSAGPVVQFASGFSVYLSCSLFWLIQSLGTGLLVAGMFGASVSKEVHRLSVMIYFAATALAAATLCIFKPNVFWIASVYALQGVFVAAGTIRLIVKYKAGKITPVYFALTIFAASSVYCASDLLVSGTIHGYVFLAVVNALVLSNTASFAVFMRMVVSAENARTDLKNTLNELMEKRYGMEMMFKAVGACEYSRGGGAIHSASLFHALGYDFDVSDYSGFLELVHPQDRYKFASRERVVNPPPGDTYSTEARIRNADGGYVWYLFLSRNEKIGGKVETLGMAVNIDLHKRMESYAMQNDRLAAVGQLANGVAHDINNYLMTIQTSLGMIESSADDKQREKFSSYMQEALANSTGMLKRLVSFSKGDEVEYAPVSMNAMLATSKELLQRSLGQGVKLSFECGAESDVIRGNYYELQNIVLNIGLNARDALPETGGEIGIRAWVSEANPLKPGFSGWYCISVRDNGRGMSAEVQKRIFDPFFTTKPHGKGSGLGLFTAYGYIQRHGGTISVESVQGAGTEFTLAFPLMSEEA